MSISTAMPVAGRVTKIAYRKGAFHDARDVAAGAENERNAIALDTADGAVGVVQIAGRVARRIRCDLDRGPTSDRGPALRPDPVRLARRDLSAGGVRAVGA